MEKGSSCRAIRNLFANLYNNASISCNVGAFPSFPYRFYCIRIFICCEFNRKIFIFDIKE